MARQKLSGMAEAILETADGLHRAGVMDDETLAKITMLHLGRPAETAEPISGEGSIGNVFADLGFSPEKAEELTAKSTLILAIKTVMDRSPLTQRQAAKVCGIDQRTLSKVLHGRMESITPDRLAHWLTALGQDVESRSGRRHQPAMGGSTLPRLRHLKTERLDCG